MVDPRSTPSKHRALPSHLGRVAALAIGFAAGAVLWGVITLLTQNGVLGLVFGLLPGVAIGTGLALTSRR